MSEDRLLELAALEADWAIERLCEDPEVWLTHGLPPEHKLARIKAEMVNVVRGVMIRDALTP